MSRETARRTEGSLLVLSAFVLGAAAVLAFAAGNPAGASAVSFWPGLAVLLTGLFAVPIVVRRSRPAADPFLIPIAMLLSGIGYVVQFRLDRAGDSAASLHHLEGICIGIAAMALGALMPATTKGRMPSRAGIRRYPYMWALLSIGLMTALYLFGSGPHGVRLSLGFFQPVELVKILVVFFVAGYLADRGGLLTGASGGRRRILPDASLWRDLAPLAAMFALCMAAFLIVRDLGPALVIFGAFVAMLYTAGRHPIILPASLAAVAAAGAAAHTLRIGVVPVRVEMWLSPWDNPHANGMQLGQSLWALSSGGLWGTGWGLGMPYAMPRVRDDLVFAAIGEELGLFGSLALLSLYAVLAARGFRAAQRAAADHDRLLAVGLSALLAGQTFLVLAGVTGLLPLTGITLPFVAYGNSSLVASFFAVGLLAGISHQDRRWTDSAPAPVRRAVGALGVLSAGALLLPIGIGRVAWIQLVRDDSTACRTITTPDADRVRRAKRNPRLLALERSIPRGSIYDRNGQVLATSRFDEMRASIGGDSRRLEAAKAWGRYYPLGPAAAHIVGYLDPNIGGPVGIERDYNSHLRGFESYADLIHDYRNKDLPRFLTRVKKRYGRDVHLALDARLQKQAVRALEKAGRAAGIESPRGAFVLLEPSTGEALVSASLPSFDPNGLGPARWQGYRAEPESARLFDRARQAAYPPGSSLKIATAAAGLEAGLDPTVTCRHTAVGIRWKHAGETYYRKSLSDDAGEPAHGKIQMARAVEESCNVFFARLGLLLGPERVRAMFADQFHLERTPPLGQVARDLPMIAFGQGAMLATPTEMARLVAAVANSGEMPRPRYVRQVREARGGRTVESADSVTASRPIGELNARRIREMMRRVVTSGTARGVFDSLPVQVAGKTGTAQTAQGNGRPHSWFVGFAPYGRPLFAFACIIENGGYGKRGAASAVNEVLRSIFIR